MRINPDRLRQLRNRKGFSRQQLADRSKISARQLSRLESDAAASTATRERTINEVAKALDVEAGVLTGELPMPNAEDRREEGDSVSISARLAPETRLAYDLIKERYGINMTTILHLGPLFFTILAEGSLAWRRKKLDEVGEAADRLYSMGRIAGHLSFAFAAYKAQEGAAGEEESIENRDLFGEEVCEYTYELGYNRFKNNPFADYLRELALQIDDRYTILLDPAYDDINEDGPMKGFPDHVVCLGDLQKITGGSTKAQVALRLGHVRLKEIPDDLRADDKAEERAQWLEGKMPEPDPAVIAKLFKGILDVGEEG